MRTASHTATADTLAAVEAALAAVEAARALLAAALAKEDLFADDPVGAARQVQDLVDGGWDPEFALEEIEEVFRGIREDREAEVDDFVGVRRR